MQDAELLHLLLQEPEEGCRRLLEQYTGFVLALVRKRIGGCATAEDIEEIAEDVLFAFYQQRERFSMDRGSVRSLLATMVHHACVDYYRAQTRQVQCTNDDAALESQTEHGEDPEQAVIRREDGNRLIAAIHKLGESDASILIWKYYFGETAAVIAERLEMRVGTVEMRISRAKQKVVAMLQQGGEDDANRA